MKIKIYHSILKFAILFLMLQSFAFAQSKDSIRIGEIDPLIGALATFGQSCHSGIQLAVEEINNNGGVIGKKIKLITEDDFSQSEVAEASARKLIHIDKVISILCEIASSKSRAAAPIAQAEKIPMITPASTNPDVTKIGDHIFRTCFIDPAQGEAMANFAVKTLHAKRAAIIIDVKQDYCMSLAQSFQEKIGKSDCLLVGEVPYGTGDTDFTNILLTLRDVHPDVIYVPGYHEEVKRIVIQMRKLGFTVPVLGGDGWDSPELTLGAKQEFNNTYFTNHFSSEDSTPAVQTFVEKYKLRYRKDPDNMAALGYDAANVLADAIKRAQCEDQKKIRDAIASTKDFPGVTGNITINADRNAVKPITILRIVDGKPHFIQKVEN
jgi:branched-chain amino acid transport system substrate-binding protein